jgi:hypothetical protein
MFNYFLYKIILIIALIQLIQASCSFFRKDRELRKLEEQINPHKRINVSPTGNATNGALCAKTNGIPINPTKSSICSAAKSVSLQFNEYIVTHNTPTEVSDIIGKAVRLAFHDAGEVNVEIKTDKLGPDGCLSSDDENAGFIESDSLVATVFEPIWQSVCDKISRADFWVLLGKIALEKVEPTHKLLIPYQFGRKDNQECEYGNGRLPSAQKGLEEIDRVFVQQMGLTLNEAVTLMGGHSVGHVNNEFSGYGYNESSPNATVLTNAWDDTPTVFDNNYYKSLLNTTRASYPSLFQANKSFWHNPYEESRTMLNTDMVLGFPANTTGELGFIGEICYLFNTSNPFNPYYGCSKVDYGPPVNSTKPSPFYQVLSYANSNDLFLSDFGLAYAEMVTVGYGLPPNIDGNVAEGKLGKLTAINFNSCKF